MSVIAGLCASKSIFIFVDATQELSGKDTIVKPKKILQCNCYFKYHTHHTRVFGM